MSDVVVGASLPVKCSLGKSVSVSRSHAQTTAMSPIVWPGHLLWIHPDTQGAFGRSPFHGAFATLT